MNYNKLIGNTLSSQYTYKASYGILKRHEPRKQLIAAETVHVNSSAYKVLGWDVNSQDVVTVVSGPQTPCHYCAHPKPGPQVGGCMGLPLRSTRIP